MANLFEIVKNAVRRRSPDDSYKMLLLGETGSGKTSFLNFLWNCQHVLDLGFDNPFERFRNFNNIEYENPHAGQMESKTSYATLYPDVKLAGDLEVGIIDTPGFGDSRGLAEDKSHAKQIVRLLQRLPFINCICLVINGTTSRMTVTLQYVLSEISAILPLEILNNIIVVFTNTSDPLDLNFQAAELRPFIGKEIEKEKIFLINNPYCRVEKAKLKYGKMDDSMIAKSLKKSFEEGRDMLQDMCTVIRDFEKVYTHHFVNLYEMKVKIDGEVTGLLMAYEYEVELEKEILKAKKDAEEALKEKNFHSNYEYTVTRWIRVESESHNTLCRAKKCYSNCHIECKLDKSLNGEIFKQCFCMHGDDYCKECGHHYRDHYHDEVLHKHVEEKVINEESKRKLEAAESMEEEAFSLLEELSNRKDTSEQTRKDLSTALLMAIEKYQELGVTRNYAKVLRTQLYLVEQRLQGDDADQYGELRKTKEEIEARCKVVELTLSEPLLPDADPKAQRLWACAVLEISITATKSEVERAFRSKAKNSHPDKPGGDEDYFKRVEHARNVLLRDKKN